MRTILILCVFFTLCFSAHAQDLVKFKADETTEVRAGDEWDLQYKEMKNPINVFFDGKVLKLYYDSGKVYLENTIISYEKKEKKDYDKKTGEIFIIKIERNEMIQYVIIESKLVYDKWINTIKIPYFSNNKEFLSYTYFQFFES